MGVAGVFGAATAASLLLKLNPPQIIAALGVAATQSSGLMAMHGFLAKPFHSGKAAANGVFAAQLALRGCTTGPALEGSLSVSHAMGGTPTPDLAQKLVWRTENTRHQGKCFLYLIYEPRYRAF